MKKVLALVLAVMMVMSLFAACGNSAANSGNAGNNPSSNDSGNSGASNNDSGNASGAIKIGMCGPLTGGAAVYGTAVQVGMQIAVEEINAMGGLQFELNCQDDEHDTEKAANAYNHLMDWGMQIMAGPVTSNPAKVVAAECVADGVFMLTPSASADAVIEYGDNIFQICFKDTNQGIASANYMHQKNLGTTYGVIYDSSDAYSTGIYEKFMAQAQANGMNVAKVTSFTADSKDNLTQQVTDCKEAGCDVVFLPFYASEAVQVLTYANTIGYEPIFFGCDGLDGILAVEGFDPALAEGVMLLTPFSADSSDAATQAFVAEFQSRTGIIPNQFAADAYDVIYSLYKACVAGGVTADMSAEEISEILVAQFTSSDFSFDGLTGKGMTWGEDGAVSKSPMAVIIENGVYVGVE